MGKIYICSLGTSIAQGLRRSEGMSLADYRAEIEARIQSRREANPAMPLHQLSAELHSLHALEVTQDDAVHLLCTDTEEGIVCAEIVQDIVVNEYGLMPEAHTIVGLQVGDRDLFCKTGIPGLFGCLRQILGDQPEWASQNCVLNASGGFKGVVPYLTLFGLIYRIPVTYIFEFTGTLITLPPAPVHFDWRLLSKARDAFVRLKSEAVMQREDFFVLVRDADHADRARLEILLESDGDSVTPSAMGELLYAAQQAAQAALHLSPKAQTKLEAADEHEARQMVRMLARISDPLWRERHIHRFSSTDLVVAKPGNVQPRAAYFERGGQIYVAELYLSHDKYELDLRGRKTADYSIADFAPWFPPSDIEEEQEATDAEALIQLEKERDALRNVQAGLEKERDNLSQRYAKESERLQSAREQVDASERRTHKLRSEMGTIRKERDALSEKMAQLQQQLQDLEAANQTRTALPWWRRWLLSLARG